MCVIYMSNIDNALVKIIVNGITTDIFNPTKIINTGVSSGTGILFNYNNNIYILTCAHVIEDVAALQIKYESNTFNAVVIGICADKDVAILQPEYDKDKINLKSIVLPETVNINKGNLVNAIGYPLNEDNIIITSGVLSGFKKNFLQVDTPVNPGNSGGPLVDLNGQLIGMVSAKLPNNVASNIGYGIPIDQIIKIIPFLIKDENNVNILNEPKLGLILTKIDKNILEYFGINQNTNDGYYVQKVYHTSLFHNQIPPNSIILKIDGNSISNDGFIINKNIKHHKLHITDYYARKLIGESVTIEFIDTSKYNTHTKNNHSLLHVIEDEATQQLEYNISSITVIVDNRVVPCIKLLTQPYDVIDFEIFGGMIFMNLTINHILNSDDNVSKKNDYCISKYINSEYRDKPVLFISTILQGSYVSQLDIFDNGEIITHINDIEVNSLTDFRKEIISLNKYIKLTSISNKFIIINVIDALIEEVSLAKMHKYKITETNFKIIKLIEKYSMTN